MSSFKEPIIDHNIKVTYETNAKTGVSYIILSGVKNFVERFFRQYDKRKFTQVNEDTFRFNVKHEASILEFPASSFYSNLFIFFSLGFVFVDKVPSKNKN